MARGRFISESIATDARLNSLSVEAELAYLMAIPHLDRDGLIEGDPDVLWGKTCVKRRAFLDMMPAFIQEWANAGLVTMYDSDEGSVLWFRGFAKNQTGLRYDRETPSKFPPPPGYARDETGMIPVPAPTPEPPPPDAVLDAENQCADELRQNSGNCSAQGQDQVKDQDQVKAEADRACAPAAAAIDPGVARVWEAWDANMPGTKSQVITDGVNALLDEYSAAEIVEAIAIACRRHKRSLGYIEGILQKGVFSQVPITTGGDYRPSRSPNRGLNAAMDYIQEKGMFNGRN